MKKTKLPLLALAAMMLASPAFVGCSQKEYGTEIEDLQKQITDNKTAINALQQAMNKGLMINKVEQTETGCKLTMSDNSTMLLTNGKDAKAAVTPQLRVNAAKNWEMSVDGGTSWNELKDAAGSPIADAKIFVKEYVKIDENGHLVIGDKTTSFQYNVAIPSVTILADRLVAVVTVPNENGGFDQAQVPMLGYFDKWSVTGIQALDGKTTLTINTTTLAAPATIGGKEYAVGSKVYHSAGLPVVLNPSMIDAQSIEFGFIASLEAGTPYALPMALKAVQGTDAHISTITKSAGAQTAIWTINLQDVASMQLKGDATSVALCAHNTNGTQTLSDYVFDITLTSNATAADATAVVDANGYEQGQATVAAAKNIVASTLYTTTQDDATKVIITRQDGTVVGYPETATYQDYTGQYLVALAPVAASKAETTTTTVELTYGYIGKDGQAGTKTLEVVFGPNSPINTSFVVQDAVVASGDDADKVIAIAKADLLAAVFGSNSIAQADFEKRGINFKVAADEEAPAGVKVEYYLDANPVANPANAAAFNKVQVTVPQTALFANENGKIDAACAFGLTYQFDGPTPPTETMNFEVAFTLDGTSPVATAQWNGSAIEIANSGSTATLDLADVLFQDAQESPNDITTTGAVKAFVSGTDANDKITAAVAEHGTIVLTRVSEEAPAADETVEVTLIVLDAWGKEHTFKQDVSIKQA